VSPPYLNVSCTRIRTRSRYGMGGDERGVARASGAAAVVEGDSLLDKARAHVLLTVRIT